MGPMASQITSLTIVHSAVHSGADQRKHQGSASLAFVRGIHRWAVKSPHTGPITRKKYPFDDIIIPSANELTMNYIGKIDMWQTTIKHKNNECTAFITRESCESRRSEVCLVVDFVYFGLNVMPLQLSLNVKLFSISTEVEETSNMFRLL